MKKRTTNRYDGALEKWKVDLALERMKAFRVPRDEWPDMLQRLVVEMLQFRFDPRRGAEETTALTRLINYQITSVIRSRQRERDRLERYWHRTNQKQRMVYHETFGLRADVQDSLAQLSERERLVAARLMQGESRQQIAQHLNCCWRTVDRIIRRIRERFEQLGLDGWVRE
ncbi:MAG: helix-turn-helix domain-containing protein [Phycisphaerae bacterium]|jgi:DNA-directed RNA polymerase specialized sigma24 family protein